MTVALIGTGKLGAALLAGLVRAGHAPDGLALSDKDQARASEVSRELGVPALSVTAAAAAADVVVIAVKPGSVAAVAAELASSLKPSQLVVSVAAGVTTASIGRNLLPGQPVVRVMTNTPLLVGEAMSVLSAGAHAREEHLDQAATLFAPVGKVLRVPESQLDAVTALSGSGPAYVFFLVEALIEAGVSLGLPRPLASELSVQTALGAARLLAETGDHPVLAREAVTSPGGTTVAALRKFEEHAVRAAVFDAVAAAHARSRELAGDDG
jgi:pyrroline-5-carboxylate reductase